VGLSRIVGTNPIEATSFRCQERVSGVVPLFDYYSGTATAADSVARAHRGPKLPFEIKLIIPSRMQGHDLYCVAVVQALWIDLFSKLSQNPCTCSSTVTTERQMGQSQHRSNCRSSTLNTLRGGPASLFHRTALWL
jgi:hypothetical protein